MQFAITPLCFDLNSFSYFNNVMFFIIIEGQVKLFTHNFFFVVFFCPQLEGVSEPVVLQVFVANDAGRVKPHGFYQACRVTGRNTTACKEVDIEGTTVIEIPLEPSNDMTLA